jgi:hypothetical protein
LIPARCRSVAFGINKQTPPLGYAKFYSRSQSAELCDFQKSCRQLIADRRRCCGGFDLAKAIRQCQIAESAARSRVREQSAQTGKFLSTPHPALF